MFMPDAKPAPLPRLEPKPLKPPAYCISCHYNIAHLTNFRCPECGHEFDPTNHRSYLDEDPEVVPYTSSLLICIVTALFTVGLPIVGTVINTILFIVSFKISRKALTDPNYKFRYIAIIVPFFIALCASRDFIHFVLLFYK